MTPGQQSSTVNTDMKRTKEKNHRKIPPDVRIALRQHLLKK